MSPPYEMSRVTISSIPAFDGAHTSILRLSGRQFVSIDIMPLIVWVLPVPAKKFKEGIKTGGLDYTYVVPRLIRNHFIAFLLQRIRLIVSFRYRHVFVFQ